MDRTLRPRDRPPHAAAPPAALLETLPMSVARTLVRATLSALAATAAAAAPAAAQVVEYYTTGTFTCTSCVGSGTGSVMFGSGANRVTLTFAAPTGATLLAPATAANPAMVDLASLNPSFASFGFIDVSGGNRAARTLNGTFTLNIFQVTPGSGSGTLMGQLAGQLSGTSSNATLDVSGAGPVVIDGVTYGYKDLTYALVPRTTNGGRTSLQGQITATTTTPEPGSVALVGSGALALAGIVVRRRRAARQG